MWFHQEITKLSGSLVFFYMKRNEIEKKLSFYQVLFQIDYGTLSFLFFFYFLS